MDEHKDELSIVFRVDGDNKLGMGHLTRCLALAQTIREKVSANQIFITKGSREAVARIYLGKQPFRRIPPCLSEAKELVWITKVLDKLRPDMIVTDLPYTTEFYLRKLKEHTKLMASIDDLALIPHCADFVISGYLSARLKRYRTTNPNTKFLIGPEYLMLRKIFEKMNKTKRRIRKNADTVLVTLGGADPGNLTVKVIRALSRIEKKLKIVTVLGPAYNHRLELQRLLIKLAGPKPKLDIRWNVRDMASLMMKSDVAITAGGETIYELAATGTPAINVSQVEHQNINARELEQAGTVINMGLGRDVSEDRIADEVLYLLKNRDLRQKMSLAGKKLVDGRGASRVANLLLEAMKNR
ncbi:MAG: UDP-2,4-diacetamido-2,4,6-trideoxy-beta-L-altropyranose hydrolase, partial [Candidatus Bathyarchaeia archaeon]